MYLFELTHHGGDVECSRFVPEVVNIVRLTAYLQLSGRGFVLMVRNRVEN